MKTPFYNPAKPWPQVNMPTHYDELPFPSGPESGGWLAAGKRAQDIVSNGGIVLLNGPWGTGKTFLAYELAKDCHAVPEPFFPEDNLFDHRRPVVYYIAQQLFDEYRAAFSGDDTAEEITEHAVDASILIIDELSKAVTTEFENQRLNHIVNLRYSRDRPTILIANYEPDAIGAAVDPSILSRIQEVGGVILCDWSSFRANPPKA